MQPVLLNFFGLNCQHPTNYEARGILSLLTKESDPGTTGRGPGQMLISGDFNVKPFDGIMLTPFKLQSPFRREE